MIKNNFVRIFCKLIIFCLFIILCVSGLIYASTSITTHDIKDYLDSAYTSVSDLATEWVFAAFSAAFSALLLFAIKKGIGPLLRVREWISKGENQIFMLSELKSPNIVTVLFHKKLRKENLSAAPTITHINVKTAHFFGINPEQANELKDENADDLMNRLEKFMDREDYIKFVGDQKRVQVEINRCVKNGDQCNVKATIPMIFNDSHPDLNYRNKSFFPVIAHEMTQKKFEYDYIYAIVLYVDVTGLKTKARVDIINDKLDS